jgi:hypothetical protein
MDLDCNNIRRVFNINFNESNRILAEVLEIETDKGSNG